MVTDAQLTGAFIPFIINDKEFQARTLTDRDYVELDKYVQFCVLKETKENINSMLLSSEERQEYITSAIRAANSTAWNSPEGARIFRSLEGVARIGWQMSKHFHSLKFLVFYEEVRGVPLTEEIDTVEKQDKAQANIVEIERIFAELNVPQDEEDEEENRIEESEEDSSSDEKSK